MENSQQKKAEEPITVDVNCNDFYDKIQSEVESDLARLKKNVEIMKDLRVTAAEMEVETAALYHAELLQNIEELETLNKKFLEEFSNETTIFENNSTSIERKKTSGIIA